jgi:hypothetical protein
MTSKPHNPVQPERQAAPLLGTRRALRAGARLTADRSRMGPRAANVSLPDDVSSESRFLEREVPK